MLDPEPGADNLAVENAAVTPAGSPLSARLRAELNPPSAVVVSLICSVVPRAKEPEVGVRLIANPGRETASGAVLVMLPAVPETVRLQEPGALVVAAVRVRTLLPDPGEAIDMGLKLAVNPVGNPLIDSDVAALKPPPATVVNLVVAPVLVRMSEELERVRLKVGFEGVVADPHAATSFSASTDPQPVA